MGGNNSAIFGKHHSLTGIDYLTIAALAGTGLGAAGIGPMAGLFGSGAAGAGAAGAGAAGMGGGTASLFGPTAEQAALLGDIGGGSSIPMFTAGEGLGAAGPSASMESLGGSLDGVSPSFLAQLQGFMRPGGPLNTGLNSYMKAQGAMGGGGFGGGQRQQSAQPMDPRPAPMAITPSSQIFGAQNPAPGAANTAGLVGGSMGRGGAGLNPQLLALLMELQQQGAA